MRILVTGGTGFIGSHLIRRLISEKHRVSVLSRPDSDNWRIKDISKQIQTIDYYSVDQLNNAFKKNKFDLIIHLASLYIKNTDIPGDINNLNEANIMTPSLLLQIAVNHKVAGFINTGSCFEYFPLKRPVQETDLIRPFNYYAATKIAFEQILKYFVNNKEIRGVTLKLFYPYGPRDNVKVIPLMIDSLMNNKSLTLTYGEQKLNFTFVEDIVDAYIKAADYIASARYKKYEVFNIGTDKKISVKKIGRILQKISGKRDKLSFSRPYPENEIMDLSCSYEKAERVLHWSPATDIIGGLEETYNYYKSTGN